jgi:hypothetical protein
MRENAGMQVDWEQEGLIVVRDGLRTGIALMPEGCPSAGSLEPLLRDLNFALASYEREQQSPDRLA